MIRAIVVLLGVSPRSALPRFCSLFILPAGIRSVAAPAAMIPVPAVLHREGGSPWTWLPATAQRAPAGSSLVTIVYCPSGPALTWMMPWGALAGPLSPQETERLASVQQAQHRLHEQELGTPVAGYVSHLLGEVQQESRYLQLMELPDSVNTKVWEGALLLRDHLLSSRSDWRGCRVLELGAGIGLVGLALAAAGAEVVLTDLGSAMALLEANVEANMAIVQSSGGKAQVVELDWLVDAEQQQAALPCGGFDLVVGADVLYEYACIEPFYETAFRFGNELWLVQNINRAGSKPFLELVAASGLSLQRDHIVENYELWRVRKGERPEI